MANPYELLGRERKVAKLVDALDAFCGRQATKVDLIAMAYDERVGIAVLKAAGVKNASQETVNALVERIEQRDAKFQEVGR